LSSDKNQLAQPYYIIIVAEALSQTCAFSLYQTVSLQRIFNRRSRDTPQSINSRLICAAPTARFNLST